MTGSSVGDELTYGRPVRHEKRRAGQVFPGGDCLFRPARLSQRGPNVKNSGSGTAPAVFAGPAAGVQSNLFTVHLRDIECQWTSCTANPRIKEWGPELLLAKSRMLTARHGLRTVKHYPETFSTAIRSARAIAGSVSLGVAKNLCHC